MEREKISGNLKKIDLGISSFERLRKNGNLYIDKTQVIEHFLDEPNSVQLIVRPRRLGKSLNLDTICCFLDEQQDTRHLFEGLYIEGTRYREKINSAPVFCLDFKNLKPQTYKIEIQTRIIREITRYADIEKLDGYFKLAYEKFINNVELASTGLLFLTEIVHHITGKNSYIFIDEYDKLLTDSYQSGQYEEIKSFETAFLSAGLKGNKYLEKALLTGVMRVSRESVLSGLNNLQTYDLFEDQIYTEDFGLTEKEMHALSEHYRFDFQKMKEWYNGICINGLAIYNIYSVLSSLQSDTILNYWGRSGTIDMIISSMNSERMDAITRILNGEKIEVPVDLRVSLNDFAAEAGDGAFYSLLVQTGYLSFLKMNPERGMAQLAMPNKELSLVWRDFILTKVVRDEYKVRTMFDNIHDVVLLASDIEYLLSDRLSYFDLAEDAPSGGGRMSKTKERIYHVFVLGILSAYEDITYKNPPLSSRESGDGRYDILFERKDCSMIFEFKSIDPPAEEKNLRAKLEKTADAALRQIDEKRYAAQAPKGKPLIKVAVVFCGKQCAVKCVLS